MRSVTIALHQNGETTELFEARRELREREREGGPPTVQLCIGKLEYHLMH